MFANSAALVTDAFPRRELGRALGINAMVVGAGLILGPILGGLLTSFGWRSSSGSTCRIGLIGHRGRPPDPGRAGPAAAQRLAGPGRAPRSTWSALLALMTSLAFGGIYGWGTWWVIGGFVLFLVVDADLRVGRVAASARRSWT